MPTASIPGRVRHPYISDEAARVEREALAARRAVEDSYSVPALAGVLLVIVLAVIACAFRVSGIRP